MPELPIATRAKNGTMKVTGVSRMVKENKLQLAFPAKPNDPRQAYIAVELLQGEG